MNASSRKVHRKLSASAAGATTRRMGQPKNDLEEDEEGEVDSLFTAEGENDLSDDIVDYRDSYRNSNINNTMEDDDDNRSHLSSRTAFTTATAPDEKAFLSPSLRALQQSGTSNASKTTAAAMNASHNVYRPKPQPLGGKRVQNCKRFRDESAEPITRATPPRAMLNHQNISNNNANNTNSNKRLKAAPRPAAEASESEHDNDRISCAVRTYCRTDPRQGQQVHRKMAPPSVAGASPPFAAAAASSTATISPSLNSSRSSPLNSHTNQSSTTAIANVVTDTCEYLTDPMHTHHRQRHGASITITSVSADPPLVSAREPLFPRHFVRSGCVITMRVEEDHYGDGNGETAVAAADPSTTGNDPKNDDAGRINDRPQPLSASHGRSRRQQRWGQKSPTEIRKILDDVMDDSKNQDGIVAKAADVLIEWLDGHVVDTPQEMAQAWATYRRRKALDASGDILGQDEIELWRQQPESSKHLPLRNLVRLRRLLLPMTVQVVYAVGNNDDDNDEKETVCSLVPVRKSLFDLWLAQHGELESPPTKQQPHAAFAAVQHKQQAAAGVPNNSNNHNDDESSFASVATSSTNHNNNSSSRNNDGVVRHSALTDRPIDRLFLFGILLRSYINTFKGSTATLYEYHRILQLLLSTLRRFGGTHLYHGKWLILDKLRVQNFPLPLEGTYRRRRSLPEEILDERNDMARKRLELRGQYEARRQTAANRVDDAVAVDNGHGSSISKPRIANDGHLIVTEKEDGVTEDAFLTETSFMDQVNATIPRTFVPMRSRPRLARMCISDSNVTAIRDLFFDQDGALRRSVVGDVSHSKQHSYISFTNEVNCGATDLRWQIPIRLHRRESKVPTRAALEEILQRVGLLNMEREEIDDMGLLVGGSEDQSLHHDICRQWTFWLPHRGSKVPPTLGWEANRYAYNGAMADRYAPSSCLVGLGRRHYIFVGVQKDQVEWVDNNNNIHAGKNQKRKQCRIKQGLPHQIFDVVRENEQLVVLKVPNGCVFTGDFQHAGVRNVASGSPEAELLVDVNQRLGAIAEKKIASDAKKAKAIMNMFCNFKGLDQLCRLHWSTKLRDSTMVIPRDSIGYTGCKVNVSDGAIKRIQRQVSNTEKGTSAPALEPASGLVARMVDIPENVMSPSVLKRANLPEVKAAMDNALMNQQQRSNKPKPKSKPKREWRSGEESSDDGDSGSEWDGD